MKMDKVHCALVIIGILLGVLFFTHFKIRDAMLVEKIDAFCKEKYGTEGYRYRVYILPFTPPVVNYVACAPEIYIVGEHIPPMPYSHEALEEAGLI